MEQEKSKVEEAIEKAKMEAEASTSEVNTDEAAESVETVEGVVEDTVTEDTEADETEADDAEADETEAEDTEADETEEADGEDVSKAETRAEAKKRKKEEKKRSKIDPKDEKIEELKDRVARQMAEFDNFRKRTEKEKSERYEYGAKDVVEKILPIVDNFERGFQSVTEEDMANPFVDGMDKVYKQLLTVLEGLEVKPIPAKGEAFDPELHNAVMHIEDEELGENVVAEEFQKGYTYRNHVVRHSMVKVAN